MVNYDNIPQELKPLPQFVCYKLTDGKKVPKIPGTNYGASSTNPKHWRTGDVALAAMQTGNYDGIGFVFKDGGGYVGIDIDNCVSNGELSELAKDVIAMIDSYTEYSTSGNGIHIICKAAELRGGKKGARDDTKGLEIYRSGRYFVMTGNALFPDKPINERQDAIFKFMDKFLPEKKERSQTGQQDVTTLPPTVNVSDNELIDRIRRSKQGNKFLMLFDCGDTSSYANDDSRADAALMEIIAWWTKDAEQMKRIFSASALGKRPKWQRKDYQDRTIKAALEQVKGGYKPQEYAKQMREKRRAGIVQELSRNLPEETHNEEILKQCFFHKHSDGDRAKAYLTLYNNKWLCVFTNKKNSTIYRFDGQKWLVVAESELFNSINDLMELLRNKVVDYIEIPDEQEAMEDYYTKCCDTPKVNSTMAQVKNKLTFDANNFDTYPYLLNMPGGTLDLQSNRLYPHQASDYLTQLTACNAASSYKGSLFYKLLSESVKDSETREWLQIFLGYSLSGDISAEKFLIIFGEGGQGKGTLISAITAAMGDYVSTLPFSVMMMNKQKGNGENAESQMAKLKGKRLVFLAEGETGAKLNVSKLKNWTGGDIVTVRNLYENATEWLPTTKFCFHTNYLPEVPDSTDSGLLRRAEFIKFDAGIKEENADTTLKARLLQELPCIMAFLLEGWHKYQSIGSLPMRTNAMQQWYNNFFDDNDLITQWLYDRCKKGVGLSVQMTEAKNDFNDWLTGGKSERCRLQEFKILMARHGYKVEKTNKGMVYKGLGLCRSEKK